MITGEGELFSGALFEEDALRVVRLPNDQSPLVELWEFKNYSVILYTATMVKRRYDNKQTAVKVANSLWTRAESIDKMLGGN